jgi:hypothetical protein
LSHSSSNFTKVVEIFAEDNSHPTIDDNNQSKILQKPKLKKINNNLDAVIIKVSEVLILNRKLILVCLSDVSIALAQALGKTQKLF